MYPLCIKLIGLNQFIYLLAHFCSVSSPHFALGGTYDFFQHILQGHISFVGPSSLRQTVSSCARPGPWPVAPSPSDPPPAVGPSCTSGHRAPALHALLPETQVPAPSQGHTYCQHRCKLYTETRNRGREKVPGIEEMTKFKKRLDECLTCHNLSYLKLVRFNRGSIWFNFLKI
jgi:hypothetical protein